MIRMDENRLEYGSASQSSPTIDVAWFADGGITLTIPQVPSTESAAVKIIGLLIGASLVLIAPWTRGIPPWKSIPTGMKMLYSMIISIMNQNGRESRWLILALVPLLWIIVRWIQHRTLSKPTVLAITPKNFYVDYPGWLFRK